MRTVIQVSIDTHTLTKLDQWRGRAPRGQAIQRLLEIALDAGEPDMPRNPFTRRELQTTAEPALEQSVRERLRSGPWYENPGAAENPQDQERPFRTEIQAAWSTGSEDAERIIANPLVDPKDQAPEPHWENTRFVERDPYGGDPDADRDAEYPGREPLEDG